MLLGIDEAGKGPVIGPLVISFFSCLPSHFSLLSSLISKDSKQYTPKKRGMLFKELKKIGNFYFEIITAEELNKKMKTMKLNDIEAEHIANGLKKLKYQEYKEIIIDLFDYNDKILFDRLKKYGINANNIKAEHKADANYPIVAAASIGAKVMRDSIVKELNKKIGFFGSGYPADPYTIAFLKKPGVLKKYKKYIRLKWKTLDSIKQTKLV